MSMSEGERYAKVVSNMSKEELRELNDSIIRRRKKADCPPTEEKDIVQDCLGQQSKMIADELSWVCPRQAKLVKRLTVLMEEYGMPHFADMLPALDVLQLVKHSGYFHTDDWIKIKMHQREKSDGKS